MNSAGRVLVVDDDAVFRTRLVKAESKFVDDPVKAVARASAVVSDAIETLAEKLQDQQQEAQDIPGHPRTWNSISVPPMRIMSPGPRATSLTCSPLTHEPFRLPRSARL